MKKAISLLLALVLCLSLCACGGGNDTTKTTEVPTTTTPATTEPEPTAPIETEPQYETVEITMDNWADYFEFVFIEDWEINGFGESEGYSCEYRLKLRDEYASKINLQNLAITVEVAFKDVLSYATFDLEKMEYTIDGDMSSVGEKSNVWEITSLNEELCASNSLQGNVDMQGDTAYFYQILEPTVSRIQGTIELIAE